MRPALALVVVLAGCEGTISSATNPEQAPTIPELPSTGVCNGEPLGRTYRGLAGEPLEAGRLDLSPQLDRLRPLPNPNLTGNWSLLDSIGRAVGGDYRYVPALRDPSVGNTFGNVAPYWYEEADIGAFSLSLTFNFAYEHCVYAFENQRSYWNVNDYFELTDAFPTPATAARFCAHSVPQALARAGTQLELQGCVDTIMDALALGEETEPRRVWAYGCAYAVATPMYLTY